MQRFYLYPLLALCLLSAMFYTVIKSQSSRSYSTVRGDSNIPFAEAEMIIQERCISCHSRSNTDDIFKVAPNNIYFDTPEEIKSWAELIKLRTVLTRAMPPLANKTQMTDEERRKLGEWIDGGAVLEEEISE